MDRPLLRWTLRALPAILGLTSLAALFVAPFAWGAGDGMGLSPWMPPLTAVVFALPCLFLADRCLRVINQRTNAGFDLSPLLMVYGVLMMLVAIVVMVTLAVSVADPSTYERLESSDGEPALSPVAYMLSTVAMAGLVSVLLAAGMANYTGAIAENRPSRHDRREGEVDGVGELLRQRDQVP